MVKRSKTKEDANIRKVSITEHPSKLKKDKEDDVEEVAEESEDTEEEDTEETETSESSSDDDISEDDSDDDVSMNTEEILENDPLYFVLSKLFISNKKRSIADILEDIAEKLAIICAK